MLLYFLPQHVALNRIQVLEHVDRRETNGRTGYEFYVILTVIC